MYESTGWKLSVSFCLHGLRKILEYFSFPQEPWPWGRDCYFECRLWTALRSTFAGSHNVKMFSVPLSGRGLLYSLLSEWYSGYAFRPELIVPPPLLLAYFSSRIVNETKLCLVIWRIAVSELTALVVARVSLVVCSGRSRFSRGIDAKIRGWDDSGRLFPFPARVFCLVADESLLKLFDNPSFDLNHALIAFRRTKEVDWSKSSFFRWVPYSILEAHLNEVKHLRCQAWIR